MREIDVHHLGRERVICCWQVGDVLIDPGPESTLQTLMDEIEDRAPRALLLTHIHLDHAGGTGALVRAFPDVQVYVHDAGAPHLIAAMQLYRDDFLAEDPYADWTLNERERLRSLAVEALRTLLDAALREDQLDDAAVYADRLAEMEPFDSEVQQTMIQVCLRRGRRSEALRRYRVLRQRMLRSFGQELDFELSEIEA